MAGLSPENAAGDTKAPVLSDIEASILSELGPTFRARRAEVPGGVLRAIEGGEGPPLVLLHGRGAAATSFFPLLPALAEHNRVHALDLPGFGETEDFRYKGRSADDAIAFFADPIEAFLAAEGLETAAILGHSLGGFVALTLALRGRLTPRKLVLVASMGLGPEVSAGARLFFRLRPERIVRVFGSSAYAALDPPNTGPFGARSAELATALLRANGHGDAGAAFSHLTPLFGPVPNRRERLREITSPVLVVWGDKDPALPAPLAIAASSLFPRGELLIIDAGHAPHNEAPNVVGPKIVSFLAGKIA